MIGRNFIGQFFIEGIYNFRELIANPNSLPVADSIWFHQDGTPPHCGVVRHY